MSETTIVGKPVTPTIRNSTLDGHRITTPVPRPIRNTGGSEVEPGGGGGVSAPIRGGAEGHAPKRHTHGSTDISIGKQPTIDHTTSNTSSRTVAVSQPVKQRQGTRAPNPALVSSVPPRIARDEAQLLTELAQSFRDGLPESAKTSRAVADRAIESLKSFVK